MFRRFLHAESSAIDKNDVIGHRWMATVGLMGRVTRLTRLTRLGGGGGGGAGAGGRYQLALATECSPIQLYQIPHVILPQFM